MKYDLLIGSSCVLSLCVGGAVGCVMEPPQPPQMFWVEDHGDTDGDGGTNFWIGLEVGLFNAGAPVNCACGLGLQGPAGLLALLEVEGVRVTVTNTVTHESTEIVEFSTLFNNAATSNGLNDLSPAETWTGFSGLVGTFDTPMLGENEVFKVWFDVDVAIGGIGTLSQIAGVVSGGTANPDGTPVVGGPHGVVFIGSGSGLIIPGPGALAVLGVGGLVGARRRR